MSVGASELLFCSSAIGASDGGADTGVPYSNAKGGFFPNIADVDRLAGGDIIKKWFLKNSAPLDGLISPSIWIQQEPTFITEQLGLGFDETADDDPDQGNMTAWSTDEVVAVISDGADTRTVTVVGLDAAGDPLTESFTVTGSSEVLGVEVFSVVYAVMVDTVSGARALTIREGAGGTTRGSIPANAKCCWLWVDAADKGSGIHLADLPSGFSYGFWDKLVWVASVSGVRPNISVIGVEEN